VTTPARSDLDLIRSAPMRYTAEHYELTEAGVTARLNAGRTFRNEAGELLTTVAAVLAELARVGRVESTHGAVDDVRAAMKKNGQVVSR
jgi:hypothetical protein